MRIQLSQAISLIEGGGVIAIPTDTVYGLAASSGDEKAIAKIFKIKGRPAENPLVTLISCVEHVYPYLLSIPPFFEALAHTFWPGPLTLVVPVDVDSVSSIVRAGMSTAGFRVPECIVTRLLINTCGPVVAPSANMSGESPACTSIDVERIFGSDFPVLESDQFMSGMPSTVLCYVDNCWVITRQGAVTAPDIAAIIGYLP